MDTKNIICFGFGQVAKNFIKKLKEQGKLKEGSRVLCVSDRCAKVL